MSKNKRNIYLQKAKQKSLIGLGSTTEIVEAKGSIKKTMAFTGRDILLGAFGGSLAGVLGGRTSLLIGAVVTGAGHYLGSSGAAMLGVGMMASGGYQTISGSSGKDGIEGVKERFTNFQNSLSRQLFLDKIMPKKSADTTKETTNGVGEVQYFQHPGEEVSGLDYTAANQIEEQIRESARKFEAKHGEVSDVSGVDGLEGIEDRLI